MENSEIADEPVQDPENDKNSDKTLIDPFDDYELCSEDKFGENAEEFTDDSLTLQEYREWTPGVDNFDEYYAEGDFETGKRESAGEEDEAFDFYPEIGFTARKSVIEAERREQKRRLSALAARLNVISQLKELAVEHKRLKIKNGFLHKKCKDFLGKYKVTNYFEKSTGSSPFYSDDRYEEILEEFKTVEMKLESEERFFKNQMEDLEFNYEDALVIFDEVYQKFLSRQIEIASECLEEKYAMRKAQYLQRRQGKQLDRLIDMRVKFFKMKSFLERIDNEKEALNDFGEGRTVNHYTNLLVTKNRLAERLDEREEDVGRVRRKILGLAPILSHVKETAHGVNIEIEIVSSKLNEIGELNREARSLVVEQGRRKDLIRKKFSKLYQTAFLLVNPKLLQVLVNSAEELENLRGKIESSQLLLKHK